MSDIEKVKEAAEKELWEENFRIDVEALKVELRKKKRWMIVRFCKAFKTAWKAS